MANIRPFKAIRPKKGLENQIAALPYDVYNRKEACEAVKGKPISFLNIDRAETQFDESVDTYADCVYQKAHDLLWNMIESGDFIQDKNGCYYIYELEMNGRVQAGIVACASVDDYQNQVIKKHENTREEKELDRIRHVETCEAQTGPIFLAYRSQETINDIVNYYREKNTPVYNFTSEEGISHRVWVIDHNNDIRLIQRCFEQIGEIYIADGHHRAASAVKVGLRKREAAQVQDQDAEYNYFLSVLFPDDQLMIMDYNRVVKDLNGLSKEDFLKKIKKEYKVSLLGKEAKKPEEKGEITMFFDDDWYLLKDKGVSKVEDPVKCLDVSRLQEKILLPILGIEDPKTDKRIDFVGGIRGLEELERRVHDDCVVAFAMYPTSIQELFSVADAGMLMPPKSTWFEPKLRSGLFIHKI